MIAVERDERCVAALAELAAGLSGRLEIVAADALEIDEAALLRERGVKGPVRVAANLPYNIGTALLMKWLTAETWPPFWESLTLMFQREVAERIVARAAADMPMGGCRCWRSGARGRKSCSTSRAAPSCRRRK